MKTYSKPRRSVCRLCLGAVKSGVPIFDPLFTPVYNFICSVLEVPIEENDGLPSKICVHCYSFISQVETFKVKCKEADDKLKKEGLKDCSELITGSKESCTYSIFNQREENEGKREMEKEDGAFQASTAEFLLPKEHTNPQSGVAKYPVEVEGAIPQSNVLEKENTPQTSSVENLKDNDAPRRKMRNIQVVNDAKANWSRNVCFGSCCDGKTHMTPQEPVHISVNHLENVPELLEKKRKRSSKGSRDCRYCKKRFSTHGTMKRHLSTHTGEKKFTCTVCDSRFSQSSSLKRHELIHSSEKPWKCESCDERFRQKANLQCHIMSHHVDASERVTFSCQYCDKVFKFYSGLSRHLLLHKGVFYKCDVCDKVFKDYSHCQRHKNVTHTGAFGKPMRTVVRGRGKYSTSTLT